MTSITALKRANAARWSKVAILPGRRPELEATARRILSHKDRYRHVEAGLVAQSRYVPWWFIGIVHIREADGDFACQLSQGDALDRVSRHVPRGRGPFLDHPGETWDAFTRGCFDALIDCAPHAAFNDDWSPQGALTMFEEYNGLGYAARGMPSPYVWSGTDQYHSGKYVADGVFSAGAVDTQPGCAALLKIMLDLDADVKFDDAPTNATRTPKAA